MVNKIISQEAFDSLPDYESFRDLMVALEKYKECNSRQAEKLDEVLRIADVEENVNEALAILRARKVQSVKAKEEIKRLQFELQDWQLKYLGMESEYKEELAECDRIIAKAQKNEEKHCEREMFLSSERERLLCEIKEYKAAFEQQAERITSMQRSYISDEKIREVLKCGDTHMTPLEALENLVASHGVMNQTMEKLLRDQTEDSVFCKKVIDVVNRALVRGRRIDRDEALALVRDAIHKMHIHVSYRAINLERGRELRAVFGVDAGVPYDVFLKALQSVSGYMIDFYGLPSRMVYQIVKDEVERITKASRTDS